MCFFLLRHFCISDTTDISRQRDEFEHLARVQAVAIIDQISLSLASLKSINSLLRSNTEVGRQDFKTFVRSLDLGSATQALEWIPRIQHSERSKYEAAVRNEGFNDFQITERGSQGQLVRASERKEYFPVHLVEPLPGNRAALGFDLGSNKASVEALRKSRDSGNIYATSRITHVQETGDQYGILVVAPIYQGGAQHRTIEERRLNLAGFALGVFHIGDIINSAYHPPRGK